MKIKRTNNSEERGEESKEESKKKNKRESKEESEVVNLEARVEVSNE